MYKTEVFGKCHGNEYLTLYNQPAGRAAPVLRQSVENVTQEQIILAKKQTLNSHHDGEHMVKSKVGCSTEISRGKYNAQYNTRSLPHTEFVAISANQCKNDTGFLLQNEVPAYQNITIKQGSDSSYITHDSPMTSGSNFSNIHYLRQTLPPEL
jgi:hypothetical protein